MHFAVLGSASSWYVGDLRRAAGERHVITSVAWRDLQSSLADQWLQVAAGQVELTQVDAVLVRSMPPGSLEQIVFRMDALAQLESAGVTVVNSPRAAETAIDKYLATARLRQAGLHVPRVAVCQTAEQGLAMFDELGGDVVVKPLFGGEGRGLTRVNDREVARRVFKALEQIQAVLYLQEFVDHQGADLRLLVVGERVFGIRRINPDDWRTNVSLGARVEPLEVTDELAQLAQRAAAAVGATIAGVDLLPRPDGRLAALEVNAVPGWRALARATGIDIARHVLDHVAELAAR